MQWTIPIVVHNDFGAFSLTPEMIKRLQQRGCTWIEHCGHDADKTHYWLPYEPQTKNSEVTFRNDPDLVAVVQELTCEFAQIIRQMDKEILTPWRQRVHLRQEMLANLKVVEVKVAIEIKNVEGQESVQVTSAAW